MNLLALGTVGAVAAGCFVAFTKPSAVPEPAVATRAVVPADASSSSFAEATPKQAAGDGMGRPNGPSALFISRARVLPLSDAQRTHLSRIGSDLQIAMQRDVIHAARVELRAALGAAIIAGRIDASQLRARRAALEEALRRHIAKEAAVLNDLHGTLEPNQRRTVTTAIREARDRTRMRTRPHASAEHLEPLRRLGRTIRLDHTQQARLEAEILGRDQTTARSDAAERMEALLLAFERDDFDATLLDLEPREVRLRAETLVHEVQTVLSMIEPRMRGVYANWLSGAD